MCSFFFFFSSRRRHTRCSRDWSSDVCSSDLRWTRPYYRSTYVFVSARNGGFRVRSWDDSVLRNARIGVVAATPPADAMIKKGLIQNVVSYRLTIDYTTEYPGEIVDHVAAGKI